MPRPLFGEREADFDRRLLGFQLLQPGLDALAGPFGRLPFRLAAGPVAGGAADLLSSLLRECGALSERALLAASELDPDRFQAQLALEREAGAILDIHDNGQRLLEAVG